MAYILGDNILDTHYNTFANTDVNTLWGVGTGQSGYGQTGTLATVAAGNTVTATQWTNLLNKITTIANHQGSTITAITSPVTSDTISILSSLESNIATIQANKHNVASFGTSTDTSIAFSTAWQTSVTQTGRITFAGGNEARHFFNAGGKLQVSFAITGGTADAKYNEWVDLTGTLAGTYEIAATTSGVTGGTGVPTTNATTAGYYNLLDNADTTVYTQAADTSPYTANNITVYARSGTDDAVDGLGNNGSSIDVRVTYNDAAADTVFQQAVHTNLDIMDGTVTTTFKLVPPALTYISNTWGTPTWSTVTNTGS